MYSNIIILGNKDKDVLMCTYTGTEVMCRILPQIVVCTYLRSFFNSTITSLPTNDLKKE